MVQKERAESTTLVLDMVYVKNKAAVLMHCLMRTIKCFIPHYSVFELAYYSC